MKPSLWSPERAELYQRQGYWTSDSYAGYVDRHAATMPSALALSDHERSVSWDEVKRWTDAVACALVRRGLPRDTVLASWLPNRVESYMIRTACEKAGVVWLPIAHALGPHELLPILRISRAAVLVLAHSNRRDYRRELESLRPGLDSLRYLLIARGPDGPGAESIEELAAEAPHDQDVRDLVPRSCRPLEVTILLPTSGSTGPPKLCEYLLAGMTARGRAQAELFHLTRDDVIVATLPGFGPSVTPLLAAPVVGAQVVLLERPDPAALMRLIENRKATIVCAVPPIYHDLWTLIAAEVADVSSVRIWYSTAMQMPVSLARNLEARTRGRVVCGYGAVDLGGWVAASPDDPSEARWFTVGRPRGGTEIKLVSEEGKPGVEGEIWGRGPSSATGYLGDPEATREAWTEDGWSRTGDIGRVDEQGGLVILGRKVEVINRGGQKVFPAEVEMFLERHPGISRVAVVPFPDARLGQRACAYVVPRDDQPITLEDLTRFLSALGLASFKLPERLEVVNELPLASGWKVARQTLRRRLEARLGINS